MLRRCLVLLTMLSARPVAAAPSAPCDPQALGDAAVTARSNIVAAVDGAGALAAWKKVLGEGGAVAWSATEYNVDALSSFVLAFDAASLRLYRAGALESRLDDAMAGCIDRGVELEAVIPWQDVREIEAGNWVVWFKFRTPVEIRSDRGKRKRRRAEGLLLRRRRRRTHVLLQRAAGAASVLELRSRRVSHRESARHRCRPD